MTIPFLVAGAVAWSVYNQPRAASHLVQVGGESLTAYEIYQRIRFGPGLDKLKAANDASTELTKRYTDRVVQLNALKAKMGAAWQGTASDTAQSAMQPLTHAFQESSVRLHENRIALSEQIRAFWEAYNGVEYVPAKPPTSNLLNTVNPFTTDTDRAINDYNDKASKNVAIYKVYSDQSSANSAQMPKSYPMMEPGSVPPIAVQPTGHIVTWSGGHETDSQSGLGPRIGGNAQPFRPGGASQSNQQIPVAQQLPDGGATHQQSWAADPATSRPGASTGYPGSVSTPGGAPTGGAVDGVGGRPGGGFGRAIPGARGSGPGSGQPGGGPRAGLGGTDPQGRAAQGAAASAARAAAGVGGTPIGVGRGKGDEDAEHQNKYLRAPDPNTLFGSDELTPPAVIGEDED